MFIRLSSEEKSGMFVNPAGLEAYRPFAEQVFSPQGLPVELQPLKEFPRYDALDSEACMEEAYGACADSLRVSLYADTPRAIRYFLQDIAREEVPAVFCGQPSFKIRGLIEGFYGKPWTQRERLSAIRRMAARRLNVFVYGPKDDLLIRENWRDLYDDSTLGQIIEIKRLCDSELMDFYYLLAPAFSIRYTSEDDFRLLVEKYRQLHSIGIRTFGLLLDDIPERFLYPQDAQAYESLSEAHIDLCNRACRALKEMDPSNRLIVCPKDYWGDGGTGYLRRLGRELPADCDLFYTGEYICSPSITSGNARRFAELTGRPPLYWDNYPVNDAGMTAEIHIGPITGRSADLYKYSRGLVMNPMELMEASMVSCATIADYLYDSPGYDAAESFRSAVEAVLGSGYAEAMEAFHGLCYKSCLTYHYEQFPADHPLAGRHEEFNRLLDRRDWAGMKSFAEHTRILLLKLSDCENRDFVRDCRGWLDAALAFTNAVALAVALRSADPSAAASPLRAYLRLPEDVMKAEAAVLLDLIENSGTAPCGS